ncbi:hypothetical protein Tco_0981896 [Tanacetum coccineum]
MIISLTIPSINADIEDKIMWQTNGGVTTDFKVSIANQDLNRQSPVVPWRKLVWKETIGSSKTLKEVVRRFSNNLSGIKVKDNKVVSDVEKRWKISYKRAAKIT